MARAAYLAGAAAWSSKLVTRRNATSRLASSPRFSSACGGGRFAKFRRGLQGGPYPVRAVGVTLLNHPRQRPGRLGEPVLQVAPGPADLTVHQAGGFPAQMVPGRPPAQLTRQPAADGAGQQLGLAHVVAGDVKEPAALGQPAFRLGNGEIQAQQFGGRVAQHLKLALQGGGEPGIYRRQSLLDGLLVLLAPGFRGRHGERGEPLAAQPFNLSRGGLAKFAVEQHGQLSADLSA